MSSKRIDENLQLKLNQMKIKYKTYVHNFDRNFFKKITDIL